MVPNRVNVRFGIACSAVLLMATATSAVAATPTAVLVELFTSEGCSDCPPAESFLRALDHAQPVPGEQLIVLEEHVDYWDDQGWKDPFSAHAFTVRQGQYVERLDAGRGAYTPQMVVDGSESFVGSNRADAARAFQKQLPVPKVSIELSPVHAEKGQLSLRVVTGASPAKAEVFAALALDQAESQVARGENGGKHLEHVAVARRITKVGEIKKGEQLSQNVSLPVEKRPEPQRVVIFLQQPGGGKILGAAVSRIP